uniref:SHH signaling and ciliogenesis regulator SDCCAG8 n=2 Tax=Myotis myotis TaxID=51298 RepID=A0A7J7RV38_MYOMY|nr:SHH signaling and ciliogenesis regulator SDCCAG8 [Myotis myotis]
MKQRLQQLDQHSQAAAQQLVQLLSKQNDLLQERQSLSEEVERLRAQRERELETSRKRENHRSDVRHSPH